MPPSAPPTARSGLDYFCVGPLWATPTKPGRAAVGLDLVRYAAEAVRTANEERVGGLLLPWFAIGGIDRTNVEQVLAAGASRIVVVRAITEAPDPAAAAAELLDALDAAAPGRRLLSSSDPARERGLGYPLKPSWTIRREWFSASFRGDAPHQLACGGVLGTGLRLDEQLRQGRRVRSPRAGPA